MDDRKRKLRGSPRRDAFKQWHKQRCHHCYATDLDFIFVKKTQRIGKNGKVIKAASVVAVIDYKADNERITFAEIITYNDILTKWGIPIYIVRADVVLENGLVDEEKSFTSFTVERYWGGDWRPDPEEYELETVFADKDEKVYWEWEMALRDSIEPEDFQHPNQIFRT